MHINHVLQKKILIVCLLPFTDIKKFLYNLKLFIQITAHYNLKEISVFIQQTTYTNYKINY